MIDNKYINKWKDSDVESHWDSVADIYVHENTKVKNTHDQRFKESILKLSLSDGMKVLNISSRDSEANDFIMKNNSRVEVINAEISGGLIEVALKLRPSAKQIKINSYSSLPFESNSFDRILTLETLEHVPDPLAYLNELHRVGKNNCQMVLSCPPNSAELGYRVYTLLFGGHGEGPHKFPAPKNVKQMLNSTGWRLLEHKGTLLIPVGPGFLRNWGEEVINKYRNCWISNLGIRQFFVCERD